MFTWAKTHFAFCQKTDRHMQAANFGVIILLLCWVYVDPGWNLNTVSPFEIGTLIPKYLNLWAVWLAEFLKTVWPAPNIRPLYNKFLGVKGLTIGINEEKGAVSLNVTLIYIDVKIVSTSKIHRTIYYFPILWSI